MGTERLRAPLCWLAAGGALLGVAVELFGRLGWRDPLAVELVQGLTAGLNVGALVALGLGAVGLALATRSGWWIAAACALGLRIVMACVELSVFDVEAGPPAAGLMAMAGLTVVAGWGSLGLAILARRRDGSPALGVAAGALVVVMTAAFAGLYLGFETGGPVPTLQVLLLDLSQALSLVGLPMLSAFLLSAATGRGSAAPAALRPTARGLASWGALLMSVALGAILYAAPVGWLASEATAMAGLVLGCVGLVLFGWTPSALGLGPAGWVVAGLVWSSALGLGLAVVFDTSVVMAWTAAGLSSLSMLACGAILLGVRGPGSRPAWTAGALLILGSAVGLTWAALGLDDAVYEARELIRVLTTIGFLAGFSLAAVALLIGARWPRRTLSPPDLEGGAA